MKISAEIQRVGTCAMLLAMASASWAQCETDGSLTGAASVLDLQGYGKFDCTVISGDEQATMFEETSFMVTGIDPVNGGLEWEADKQVDVIFVVASLVTDRAVFMTWIPAKQVVRVCSRPPTRT